MKISHWRPRALLQQEHGDCGIAAIAAIAAMYGHPICPGALRDAVGDMARGLTIRAIRDVLRMVDFGADVANTNVSRMLADPAPCIALWRGRHFVVLGRRRRRTRDIFDPSRGWMRSAYRDLEKDLTSFAIYISRIPEQPTTALRRPFPLRRWLQSFQVARATMAIAAIIIIAQCFNLGLPRLTGRIVDASTPGTTQPTQVWSLMVFALAGIFALVSSSIGNIMTSRLKQELSVMIAKDVTERVMKQPPHYIRRHDPESLVARIIGATPLRDLLSETTPAAVLHAITALGALFLVARITLSLALVGLTGVAIKILLDTLTRRPLEQAREACFSSSTIQQSSLVDAVRGAPVLRAYLAIDKTLEKLRRGQEQVAQAEGVLNRIRVLQTTLYSVVDILDRTLFLVIASWLMSSNKLGAGDLIAITLYRESLVGAIDGLRQVRNHYHKAIASAGRLEDLYRRSWPPAPLGAAKAINRGDVAMVNVSFRYNVFSPMVFSDVSLNIRDGEHVAVVGPSGCGKSTLAKLICGTLRTESGAISVGGVDLASPGADAALVRIGTVMQDDHLFAGTIRENIDMFRGFPDDAIERAAKLAEIHETIMAMPMRYATQIGDDLGSLSGGQRQRILLARALCGNVLVLIMDEATSALDVETERTIMQRVSALKLTRITFAHRLETINAADRVIDMRTMHTRQLAAA